MTVSNKLTLEVTDNMGDLGVVSYLNDEHGNIVVVPTTCSSKPPTANMTTPTTSTTPSPKPASTIPLCPTSTAPSEENPKKKSNDEKKKEKKKVTKRKDSVILNLPTEEVESHEPNPTMTPDTPGTKTTPLP